MFANGGKGSYWMCFRHFGFQHAVEQSSNKKVVLLEIGFSKARDPSRGTIFCLGFVSPDRGLF